MYYIINNKLLEYVWDHNTCCARNRVSSLIETHVNSECPHICVRKRRKPVMLIPKNRFTITWDHVSAQRGGCDRRRYDKQTACVVLLKPPYVSNSSHRTTTLPSAYVVLFWHLHSIFVISGLGTGLPQTQPYVVSHWDWHCDRDRAVSKRQRQQDNNVKLIFHKGKNAGGKWNHSHLDYCIPKC